MKQQPTRGKFGAALKEARTKLKLKLKERTAAAKTTTRLDIEIPALERTIQALENQINPSSAPLSPPKLVHPMDTYNQPDREVPNGAGFIPATPTEAAAVAMTVDDLPGMSEGGWV